MSQFKKFEVIGPGAEKSEAQDVGTPNEQDAQVGSGGGDRGPTADWFTDNRTLMLLGAFAVGVFIGVFASSND